MMTTVVKATQIAAAAVLGLSVLLVFIHPATVGLPAPDARHAPLSALLGSAVLMLFTLALPLVAACHDAGDEIPVLLHCDRLALTCTRLC